MKGFNNIGNTCYLNSGLQMLIQNKDFCQLIINYSSKSIILNQISEFIKKYYDKSQSSIIIPTDIKKIVEDKLDIFKGFEQQDTSEFIICLINIIDDEIKKVDSNSNGIQSIFGITFNIRIKCKLSDCLQIYNKTEVDNFLLLNIDSECFSLDDAYRKFKSGEKLDGDNKYFCENCKVKRIASKRQVIDKWSKYINIYLKRFNQSGNTITKNNNDIDIPLEWRHDNKLQGAVVHFGNLNSGHYVYVGKQDSKWYLFNDSSISEINNHIELKKILSKSCWLHYLKH